MEEVMPAEGELRRLADFIKKTAHGGGSNIRMMSQGELRQEAIPFAVRTRYGSYCWRSAVSSRIGPKTVYLGSPRVSLPSPTEFQQNIIRNSPEELEKVIHLLETIPFVKISRQIGSNDVFNPRCHLYTSVADRKNIRLPYMWSNTTGAISRRPGPDITMIHIPEEHQMRQQVLAIPEANLNIALGTDYMGEDKKGFLRQSMWLADEAGMLGLHAGTKMVCARDPRTKQLKRYGVFLFGLSATGKSTWACHGLGLDQRDGESTEVTQDDVVFLCEDGSALGSEFNFYVKTDVTLELQESMYRALTHSSALIENVIVDSKGNPDFMDESLCGNGRAVVQRKQLKVRSGWRMRKVYSKSLNLPPLSELDGIIFAFITRRNTIMPFAQRLTPEQAVLAYLWGESTHSYASQPDKAGESVRTVGTDPFIVGSRAKKVNRFHDIIMKLNANYPGKVMCFQYNTGGIGEIIDETIINGKKTKKLVRKVQRVPIDVMAAIQRGDVRGTNVYEPGRLGTERIARAEGKDLTGYDVEKLYSSDQIENYIRDIIKGRRKYTEEIAGEGLIPEVKKAAEKSFDIIPPEKKFHRLTPVKRTTPQEEEIKIELRKPDFQNTVPRVRVSRPPQTSSRYNKIT